MTKIQRIQPISAMRIFGIVHAGLGLVIAVPFGLVFALMGAVAPDPNMPRWLGFVFGPLFVIFIPIFYGCIGAVMGGFGAVLYNFATRFVGGIEFELVAVVENPAPIASSPA
jgi:hypothetical protein